MLRLIRLQPHLRLLDGMLPVRLMQIPQLNRRNPTTSQHTITTITEKGKTHTTNPTTIPNHNPSSFHFNTHPTEKEIGSATR